MHTWRTNTSWRPVHSHTTRGADARRTLLSVSFAVCSWHVPTTTLTPYFLAPRTYTIFALLLGILTSSCRDAVTSLAVTCSSRSTFFSFLHLWFNVLKSSRYFSGEFLNVYIELFMFCWSTHFWSELLKIEQRIFILWARLEFRNM